MMLHDAKTSVSVVIALGLWAVVIGVMVSAVVTMLEGHWRAGFLLSQLSLTVACGAIVAHVRIYVIRLSSMIRNLYGLEAEGTVARQPMSRT